jgi:hypothetical protein
MRWLLLFINSVVNRTKEDVMRRGKTSLALCCILASFLVNASGVAGFPVDDLPAKVKMLAQNNPEVFERVLAECQESDFQIQNLRMCSVAYSYDHYQRQADTDVRTEEVSD